MSQDDVYKKRQANVALSPISPPLNPVLRTGQDDPSSSQDQQKLYTKKGLSNLGNTCFMNSALQCLFHTIPLSKYFLERNWEKELNYSNPLGMRGDVPKVYAQMVYNIWSREGSSSFAPRAFKHTIGELNATFAGYGQQDSHELLQSLLDGLHEDLNRIHTKKYIEDPEMASLKVEEFASLSWTHYLKRNDSIIVDLFQAQLMSRTECQICQHISIKFDPYMYLQLPIPESKTVSVILHVLARNNINLPRQDLNLRPRRIKIEVPRNCLISDLKLLVARKMNWSKSAQSLPSESLIIELFNNKIHRHIPDSGTINDLGRNDINFVVELEESNDIRYAHVPTLFTFDSNRSYQSIIGFGLPLLLKVQKTFITDIPRTKNDIMEGIGLHCYDLVIEALYRYSLIPLFRKRGSSVDIHELVRRSKDPSFEGDLTNPDNLSWTLQSDEWEPIPNLFKLANTERSSGHTFRNSNPSVIIYPYEYEMFDTPSTPHTSHNITSDYEEPSRKSDFFSELAGNFNDKSIEKVVVDSESFSQSSTANPEILSEFEFGKEGMQFVMEWEKDIAQFVFGESSIPNHSYDTTSNSSIEDPDLLTQKPHKKITLEQCMAEFTKEELLDGPDTMFCSKCKAHQVTKKQLSVFSTPDILVIHLKRFTSTTRHSNRSKLDDFVEVPIDGLDMSLLMGATSSIDLIYDLFAVSNHFGGMGGGHYTAYTKDPLDNQWYDCDDSRVTLVTGDIITQAAYLLFYQRRHTKFSQSEFKEVLVNARDVYKKEMEQNVKIEEIALPLAGNVTNSKQFTWNYDSNTATANNSRVNSDDGIDPPPYQDGELQMTKIDDLQSPGLSNDYNHISPTGFKFDCDFDGVPHSPPTTTGDSELYEAPFTTPVSDDIDCELQSDTNEYIKVLKTDGSSPIFIKPTVNINGVGAGISGAGVEGWLPNSANSESSWQHIDK